MSAKKEKVNETYSVVQGIIRANELKLAAAINKRADAETQKGNSNGAEAMRQIASCILWGFE